MTTLGPQHPAPVRLLLACAGVCTRTLCACGWHAWHTTRPLNSTLEVCVRPGCAALRDNDRSDGLEKPR